MKTDVKISKFSSMNKFDESLLDVVWHKKISAQTAKVHHCEGAHVFCSL